MTSNGASNSVLMIAAEASSALYAQRLLELWRDQGREVRAFGVGNQAMMDLGFEALGRAEDMAVVGIQEVLAHFSEIKAVFKNVVAHAKDRKPLFALLLDYPGFNLRLAKELKKMGIPVVYYISPQIWAWRQGRVRHMKKNVDKVLTLFPFENQFYEKHGVPVEFVGHPLLDELERLDGSVAARARFRQRYGIDEGHFVLGLMPGSRRSELKHHFDVQLEAARILKKDHPNLKVALLAAPGLPLEIFQERLEQARFPVILVRDEPFQMIQMTDAILCASGTATLMVGLLEKPMVIMYRMNAVTACLARFLVGRESSFGMVNLILGRKVVPERFQSEANPRELASLMSRYVSDREYREETRRRLSELHPKLGERGASARVAEALRVYFDR